MHAGYKAFVLFSALLLVSGCTQEVDLEELKTKLIEANSDLDSYTAEMQMKMVMDFKAEKEELRVESDMKSDIAVEQKGRRLKMSSTVNSRSLDMGGQSMYMQTETYIVDNTMYMKNQGVWIKMDLVEDVWDSQDQVKQMLELIRTAKVERLEDEEIDGESHYVVKADPDIKALFESLAADMRDFKELEGEVDFSKLVKDYTVTFWVNKETYVIRRESVYMRMVVTPEDFKSKQPQMEGTMQMSMDGTVDITSINEPVEVELPAAAYDAVPLEQMQRQMGQQTGMY